MAVVSEGCYVGGCYVEAFLSGAMVSGTVMLVAIVSKAMGSRAVMLGAAVREKSIGGVKWVVSFDEIGGC